MWKKLTALSLSLLICLSMLPAQAGAMDAAEDEQPVQAEDQISPEDADAGIAPCREYFFDPAEGTGGLGAGLGAGDTYGGGGAWGPGGGMGGGTAGPCG